MLKEALDLKSWEIARILDQTVLERPGESWKQEKLSYIQKRLQHCLERVFYFNIYKWGEIYWIEWEGGCVAGHTTSKALPCQPAFHAWPALPCDLYRWRYCWLLLILAQPTGNDSSTLFIIPQDQVDPTQKVLAKISIWRNFAKPLNKICNASNSAWKIGFASFIWVTQSKVRVF